MTHCVITPFFATKIFVAKSHFSNEFAFHSKKKNITRIILTQYITFCHELHFLPQNNVEKYHF